MRGRPGGATGAATTVRWLLAIGLVVVSAAMPGPAWAYWTGGGGGSGIARVATLPAPTVTATSPQFSDRVDVSWTPPVVPAGMAITGYRVVRVAEGTPVPACGSSVAAPLPAGQLDCSETGLPDGALDYVVTALVGTWTTTGSTSAPVVVAADRTAPTIRVSGADESHALLDRREGEPLLFFQPSAAGSFRIDAELTDDEVGPASVTFPEVAAPGWSHASETVATGTGAAPTIAYRSEAFTFGPGAGTPAAMEITGTDARGNARDRRLVFVPDSEPPTGGAMVVNGTSAHASGTLSWDVDGAFSVTSVTPFVEEETSAASGLADVALTRESAVLSDGSCGAFGGSTPLGVGAPIEEVGLADGCYRYVLTGVDRVGNSASVASTVRVDSTAPLGGALQANAIDAEPGGSTSITSTGTWSVVRTDFTDPGSGITSSTLIRDQAALTAGACGAFGAATTLSGAPGEADAATACYRYVLAGVNAAGLMSELSTTVWVDRAAPTGGALTVNAVAATAAGTTSVSTSSSVTVSVVTGYVDANSGIQGNQVTRTYAPMLAGVCGTFDPVSTEAVAGTAPFAVTGLADGCHRFTLTGTDVAGNTSSVSTTIRLDASGPVPGSLTVNGVGASDAGTTSGSAVTSWSAIWSKLSDPESGMATSSLVRTQNNLSAGACTGAWGSTATISMLTETGTAAQSGLTTARCYRYVLSGTNSLGLTSTLTTIVRLDTSAPTAGAMSVNAVSASSTGSNSVNGTGSFGITVTSVGADTNSGVVTTLVRTQATVAAGVCGTSYATPVTLPYTVGTASTQSGLAPGCYRYTLTTTNGVGTARVVLSTVRIDTTGPVGGALTVNGVDATSSGSSSTAIAAGFSLARTDWTDPESTVTSVLTRAPATLAGGVCGGFGTATTVTGTAAQTGLATGCYRYVLTGTNTLVPPALTLTTIVMLDTTPPTAGAFTVNGSAASAAGTSTTVLAGANFSVTAFTGYTDAQSTLVSSTFTRTTGESAAGVCGSFDGATTVTLPSSVQAQNGLANGCYRYVLTGVNGVGGTASITSTVRVGP